MDAKPTDAEIQQKPAPSATVCPWCGLTLRVGRDKKGRPFWRCWRCEVRSFGTDTTRETFERDGLIWTGEPPLAALQAWLKRLALAAGILPKEKR
jgi:tRNA(Ile2) C34 agmatinyltransferase TiaS